MVTSQTYRSVEKTAEEIKSSKARKYNRVKAIQGKLRDCLEDFAAGLAFYNSMYTSGYEFFCEFSDSILTSEETERQQDRQDVNMGAMTLVEYRAKWYGETEEEAAKKIIDESVDPDPIGVSIYDDTRRKRNTATSDGKTFL